MTGPALSGPWQSPRGQVAYEVTRSDRSAT